jgi:myo-inositol-1(or 4)-monophosphatase
MTPRDAALAAARAAVQIVRTQFGSEGAQTAKGVLDFATPTDVQAEQAIVEILLGAYPGYGIMAEESGESNRAPGAPWWLIDPLCGTVNFAQGLPFFNVNIALMDGTEPVLGVLAEPLTGDVLVAERGRGARVMTVDGGEARVQPSGASRIVGVDWGHFPSEGDPERMLRLFAGLTRGRQFRTRVLNTSLALGYVARGRLAAFVMDTTKPWDQGAGGFICREAGCVVTDLEGNAWTPASYGIIAAADASIYEELWTLLHNS